MKSYILRQAGMLNPDSNRRPQTFGRRLGVELNYILFTILFV